MKNLIIISLSLFISGCAYLNIPPYLDIMKSNTIKQEPNRIKTNLLWSSDIGESRDYKTGILQPVFKDGTAYSIDSNGYVSAIDLSNGDPIWLYDLDMEVSSGLGFHDNKIFFGTNDGMYYGININKLASSYSIFDTLDFINILDDTQIDPDIKLQLKSEASSQAIGLDDLVFIKLDDGDTTAINTNNGEIEWNYKGRNVPLSMKGSGAIAILNNNIYVPRDDGNIISLQYSSGKLNWLVSISPRSGRNELESLRDVEISPVIDNGVLFIGSFQGNLIAIDTFSGNIIWSRPMSILSHMSIDNENLYVSDESGIIYAIDRYDGNTLWKTDFPEKIVSMQTFVTDQYIVSLSTKGHVIVLNKLDGKLLTLKNLLSDIDPQANGLLFDKILYIVTKDGRLNAIKIN